jgi:hypothetical protein
MQETYKTANTKIHPIKSLIDQKFDDGIIGAPRKVMNKLA